MQPLIDKPEPKRHYSIENYRASAPQREWVEPTPTPTELKQRHDAVMARLHKEARQWRRMYRVLIVGYLGFAASMLFDEVFRAWLHTHYPGVTDILPIANLVATLSFWCVSHYWKQTMNEMAESADVRDIGAFIEALNNKHAVTQPALLRLLPEMRATDGDLLQELHRVILRKLINSRIPTKKRLPLVLAILKAYEQIGDEDDIPVVEKIASGFGYGKCKQVRQTAEDCLPALRIVAPQHRAQITLLRASNSNSANPADLVRPVEVNAEVNPNEMLRASIVEAH